MLTRRKATITGEPARPGDQRSNCADTAKLVRHLGWKAKVGLDEGLAMQLEWQAQTGMRAAA
jgi:nucleoside-diphosphate-sugar epimerase